MRILGIDPSLTNCGVAILEDGELTWSHTIKTSSSDPTGERLNHIYDVIRSLVIKLPIARDELTTHAVAVAIEGYAMGAMFSREQMGEVGGVIKLAARRAGGCDAAIWPPGSWRKLVLGSGKLPKDEVRVEVFKRYGVELKDHNQLEAFCVAMAEYLAQTGAKRPRPKKRAAAGVAGEAA